MKSNRKGKTKYKFAEIASRVTGIGVSIPVFGVSLSWQPSEPERKIIRDLFIFLEDRRALYNPFAFEMENQVTLSILEIRKTLTETIKLLPESSEAISRIKAIRAACREYLDKSNEKDDFGWRHQGFLAHLGRLRTVFGYYVAQLSIMYGIDIEGELVNILPPEYKDTNLDNK